MDTYGMRPISTSSESLSDALGSIEYVYASRSYLHTSSKRLSMHTVYVIDVCCWNSAYSARGDGGPNFPASKLDAAAKFKQLRKEREPDCQVHRRMTDISDLCDKICQRCAACSLFCADCADAIKRLQHHHKVATMLPPNLRLPHLTKFFATIMQIVHHQNAEASCLATSSIESVMVDFLRPTRHQSTGLM